MDFLNFNGKTTRSAHYARLSGARVWQCLLTQNNSVADSDVNTNRVLQRKRGIRMFCFDESARSPSGFIEKGVA